MKNTKEIKRTCLLVGLAIFLTGCVYGYILKPPTIYTLKISGIKYNDAFSKALSVYTKLGYGVVGSDRESGIIQAEETKMLSYAGVTSVDGFLEEIDEQTHQLRLKIQSDRPTDPLLNDFISEYQKYATVEILSK